MTNTLTAELTRPIVGIENRTAQEVFDIMSDRIKRADLFAENAKNSTLPSPPVSREAISAEKLTQVINDMMRHHELLHTVSSDGEHDFVLTDMLTPKGETSIALGIEEVDHLAECVVDVVLKGIDALTNKPVGVTTREEWEAAQHALAALEACSFYSTLGKEAGSLAVTVRKVLNRLPAAQEPPINGAQ